MKAQLNPNATLAVVGLAAAGVAVWLLVRKGDDGKSGAQVLGEKLGGTAVDVATGAATGVVLGAGDAVGLPRTSTDACQAALDRGDLWEASFVCPASTFLGASWDKVKTTINPAAIDPPRYSNTGGASGSW